jgi:hypothetical protein
MTAESNSSSDDIVKIMKDEITIVSFMLLFVTFLFQINFNENTKGVFAKPLVLFLSAALFILYGIVIRISNIIIKNKSKGLSNLYNKIAKGFYVFGILLFIVSCDLLLVAIQGLKEIPEYINLQIIVMTIGIIPITIILYSILYNQYKKVIDE